MLMRTADTSRAKAQLLRHLWRVAPWCLAEPPFRATNLLTLFLLLQREMSYELQRDFVPLALSNGR